MADKKYTLAEIDQLNLARKAEYGKIYTDVFGDKYSGTKRGTLLAGGHTGAVGLSDAAEEATGLDTLDEVITQRIGKLYETIVDFGAMAFDEEATDADFDILTPGVRVDSVIESSFPPDMGLEERDPEDAVLEELEVQVTNIVPNDRIQGIVHAPNGAHGRYKLRLKVA